MSKQAEPRYYQELEEARELYAIDDLNVALREGWELIKIIENHSSTDTGHGVTQYTTPMYIVGKFRKPGSTSQSSAARPTSNTSATPNTQSQSSGGKTYPCFKCKAQIRFGQNKAKLNLDGSPHNC